MGPVVPRLVVAGLDASAVDAPQRVAGQMKAPFLDAHAADLMLPRDLGHDRAVSYTHLTLPTSDLV